MNLRKVTDDYSVIERDITPEDIMERLNQRGYRNKKRGAPPQPRRLTTRSREREFEGRREVRRSRRSNKLCTNCGAGGLTDGFRMCLDCRLKWRVYNARCSQRKILSLTPYSLTIDRH